MSEENLGEKNNSEGILWIAVGTLSVMAICLITAAFVVTAALLIRPSSGASPDPTVQVENSDLAEETLSTLSSVEVPSADPPSIAERLYHLENVPDVVAEQAALLELGVTDTFWVTDVGINETRKVEAELVFVSEHVYFWIEKDLPVDLEDVRRIVENFEKSTYPGVHSLIGREWSPGVDGDPHLYMLYVRGIGASVAGSFFSKDEYSSLAQKFSNEHEMFYLNADSVDLEGGYVESLLAHEFQHMVHWNLDRNEDTWMNEGFSELVEHLLGFEVGGFDYAFSNDTDIPLLIWPSEPGNTAAHYGQAFLYMTYLYDRFGMDAIRLIAQNPANGLDAIELMLIEINAKDPTTGERLTVEKLFLDWGISLAIQDPAIFDGRFGLKSYPHAPEAQYSESYDSCPLDQELLHVAQYGIDLIHIDCQGEFELRFSGQSVARVVSADPRTGSFAFWSNKGDESDMTLTRTFDFGNVSGEILFEYWTWYHIEEAYDYLYLEASVDGGQTWNILTTPSGTSEDPSGNSYGWAYNGKSGNGESPVWIHEVVDLSAFAGAKVMLRFEYITDTAVNTEGFLLDDLRIKALGYQESFENGNGGWEAQGFVRMSNRVPQGYKVALIERGEGINVREVEVDSSGLAEIKLVFDDEIEDVILVVAGTSRHSWIPAEYIIEIVR